MVSDIRKFRQKVSKSFDTEIFGIYNHPFQIVITVAEKPILSNYTFFAVESQDVNRVYTIGRSVGEVHPAWLKNLALFLALWD